MHDATSYQISVSTLPTLFHPSSPSLCLSLSLPLLHLLSLPPFPTRLRFAPSRAALHALLPSLDISDSKHNSNPGGLYARWGNSSVATQSSSLIEISYPLTYLPAKPHLGCARLVHSNVRHPEYFLLQESAITRLQHHPTFSTYGASPSSCLTEIARGKNNPRRDVHSKDPRTRETRSAQRRRGVPYVRRGKYVPGSCEQSRESESRQVHRAAERSSPSAAESLRASAVPRQNVKDIKDCDGVLDSSDGTRGN